MSSRMGLSSQAEYCPLMGVARGDWRPRVEAGHTITAEAEDFPVSVLLDAYEGDSRVFSKGWTFRFPRDLV